MANAFSQSYKLGQELKVVEEENKGQSLQLQELEAKIHRLEKEINGWNAVLQGGLAKGLASCRPSEPGVCIERRMARRFYGHLELVKFIPSIHDRTKK